MIKGSLLEIGKITKWMEKEFLSGLIKGNIPGSTKKIKNMDMELLNGNKITKN